MTSPILYVEDELDYQILVQRILNRAGLEVNLAETGAEGMKALERERPSLLILDINLPDTDGYEICGRLRRDPAWMDLPILLLTVRRRPEEWLQGFSSGAHDYLSKPFNPPELIERVMNCLAAKTSPEKENRTAEYSLIQSAVSGNRAAFEVLIQKYRERLMTSLRNTVNNDAQLEDVVAQAFSRAFETLKNFRGEASFYTWVYRIALNDSIRVPLGPNAAISLDELADGEESHLLARMTPDESLENAFANKEFNHQAREALESVPDPFREILELFILQDLSYGDISKKLRIPPGTVMSRLHRARKLFQDAWSSKEVTPA